MAVFVLIVGGWDRKSVTIAGTQTEVLDDIGFDERKHTGRINMVLSKLQDKGAKIISITPFEIPWPTYDSGSAGPVGYLIAYESARAISMEV